MDSCCSCGWKSTLADSISKRIILAVIGQLGAPESPPVNITRSRTIALSDECLPEISVYRVEEDPTFIGDPRRPTMAQRHIVLEIAITAEGDDDACEPYHQWVVRQMMALPSVGGFYLGGLAKSVSEIKTVWNPDEGSDGSSMTTFLRYRVEYLTLPGDITTTIQRPTR